MIPQPITIPLENDSERKQLITLMRALDAFKERNALRADLWAEFDCRDSLHHADSKLARAHRAISALRELSEASPDRIRAITFEAEDSLIDLINFAAFTLRHIEAGRLG